MKNAFWIAIKDMREISHQPRLIAFLLLYPAILVLILTSMFSGAGSIENVPIVVVCEDEGAYSKEIVKGIGSVESIRLHELNSTEEAEKWVMSGRARAAIIIPENFTEVLFPSGILKEVEWKDVITDMKGGDIDSIIERLKEKYENTIDLLNSSIIPDKKASIILITDPAYSATGQFIESAVRGIVQNLSYGVSKSRMTAALIIIREEMRYNPSYAAYTPRVEAFMESMIQPVTVDSTSAGGGRNIFVFIFAGLIGLISLWTGVMLTAKAIVSERTSGTLEWLMGLPVSKSEILLGKIISNFFVVAVQVGIIILFSALIMHIPVSVNALAIICLIILDFVVIGAVLSSFASNLDEANNLGILLCFPMMFLSGFFYPTELMPDILSDIANVLPSTYGVAVLRLEIIGTLGNITLPAGILAGFAAAGFLIGSVLFRETK